MRFKLTHEVHGDAHHNEKARAAEIKRYRELAHQHLGNHADQGNIDRAPECNAGEHPVNVLAGFAAGTDARYEPALLLQVFRDVFGIKDDGGVEEAEEHDQGNEQHVVQHRLRREPARHLLQPGSGGETRHRRREDKQAGCEDRRNDARCVHFQGQVRGLSAVHLTAHLAFGVVDGNAPLRPFHKHNAHQHRQHEDDQDNDLENAERARADEFDGVHDRAGKPRDDAREDDKRDAVADAPLGDLLAEPHDKHGPGGHGDDRDQLEREARHNHERRVRNGAVHAFQHRGEAEALHDGDKHGAVPGVLRQFFTAGLPFFLGHALDVRAHHLQKLHDDGRGNVGHDPEGEDRQVGKAAAGEHVENAEKRVLHGGKKLFQRDGVNARHGHMHAQPVSHQQKRGPKELLAKLRDARQIFYTGKCHGLSLRLGCSCSFRLFPFRRGGSFLTANNFGRAARLLDFFRGGSAELVRFNRERGRKFAVAENLHGIPRLGEAAFVDVVNGYRALAFKRGKQKREIDDLIPHAEGVVLEAALGQTALQRHLAAFKPGGHAATGAGVLALVAFARGAARAGAAAATDAFTVLAFFREGVQLMQLH
ncbi:hypothetical protein KL86DPRO_60065 [uncultured delta proteobacterium]|uniref:Uncharacterized protein n=1 Tax=uncultured delta proteobacterium TaxID=34034 RepID=A0A212KEW4_9DELT|nr:hypothetical protein KL86DPRO_60065 [uncultured delta proteobacterium]